MAIVRSKGSLRKVAETLTLRCDAKQADSRFLSLDESLSNVDSTRLSVFLPLPFVKGRQPVYVEDPDSDDVAYVVSTLAVRPLRIIASDCRRISSSAFDALGASRQLKTGDVVLTMDGGTSIGKAAVFDSTRFLEELGISPSDGEEARVTVDSHVAILRPQGISSLALAYLLTSPIGQLQFQRAESGASGQTAVTEDDVRYFRFPKFDAHELEAATLELQQALDEVEEAVRVAQARRQTAWSAFESRLLAG
jgi:hypothetical protein